MTNAATARQLIRSALHAAGNSPDGGVEAATKAQAAIAHALLDLAAAVRELPPITTQALGPINIDDRYADEDNPPAPLPRPQQEDAHNAQDVADKIRRDLAGRS